MTARGEHLVVHLSITNTGTTDVNYTSTFHTLQAAGHSYEPDTQANLLLGGIFARITPGNTVEVPLAFDVPEGTKPESLTLINGVTDPGVTIPFK